MVLSILQLDMQRTIRLSMLSNSQPVLSDQPLIKYDRGTVIHSPLSF